MKGLRSSLMAAAFLLAAVPTAGASPVGSWVAAESGARVEIAVCGSAYCGTPTGQKTGVVFKLQHDGRNRWQGPATSRQDGQTHDVWMTFATERTMIMKGCLAVLCIEQVWTRAH